MRQIDAAIGVVAGVILGMVVMWWLSGSVRASENSRFEHIYTSPWVFASGTTAGYDKRFVVYHDKDSGNEIICADEDARGSLSCFLSGRNWKDK